MQRGVTRFENNLHQIITAVRDLGADCILMTQAANLRSFAPSYSVFTRLSAEERDAYDGWLQEVQTALAMGQEVEPRQLSELLELDDGVALTWFLAGQVHEQRGATSEAREAFLRALELDRYPNRASAAFNSAIRQVARERRVTLVDAEDAMADWATGAVPGEDLFFDHCHPDVDATFRLGAFVFQTVAKRLVESGVLTRAPTGENPYEERSAVDEALQRMGLDRAFLATRSLGAARLNLLAYLESPHSDGPLNLAASAYRIALQVDPKQVEALSGMTVIAILQGEPDRALGLAQRATVIRGDALAPVEAMAAATPTLTEAMRAGHLGFDSGHLVRLSQ